MNTSNIFLILLVILFLSVGMASADIYKWVDEDGTKHFSNHPPLDPGSAEGEIKVTPTKQHSAQNETDVQIEKQDSSGGSRTIKKSKGRKEHEVELYITSWCPYCKKALSFFRSWGIPFTAYDIEKEKEAARRKNRLDSKGGVPFAIINGQRIHGFSPQAYERALRNGN